MAKGEKLHASIWSKDGNRKTADEVLSGLAFAAFWKYPILRQTLEAPKVVEEGKQRPEVLILGSGQSEELEDDEIQDEDQDEDQDQDEDPDQDKDQDQDEDQDEDTDQDEDKDQDAGRSEEFLESVWFYEFWR